MSGLQDRVATYQRTWAQVDLDAIVDNMKQMKQHISADTRMIGVIKTEGYGHGAAPIAHALEPLDFMYGFAVATPEEAHSLRVSGVKKPILILGYTFPYCYEMLAEEEIRPAVFREDSLELLDAAAKRAGSKIRVHIKVDTGMSRIGVTPDEEGLKIVKKALTFDNIEIEGIFTHFARADEYDKTNAYGQLKRFKDFIALIERETGYVIPVKHIANSAGLMEIPEADMDVVRAGIILYGLYPSDEVSREILDLKPALSLYSRIAYIKTLHEGAAVSYGGTFKVTEDMRVATVPIGYGDGYPRSLSGKGYVLIRGCKAPILGRVCMDQMMVDVSNIPGASADDVVTLIGTDGEESISMELLGDLSGRFNYELACDLGNRIPRVYVKDGEIVCVRDNNDNFTSVKYFD